jgi:nitroimidazol reductase NimA-like FMN-containing flavoprotein (pyridoxamine 5'-phosphate oxidase superfamily)
MTDTRPPSGSLAVTPRTALHRIPKRGSHERAVIHDILDAGLVCHVGFVADGQPFVIPTAYGRAGETLYIHGAAASRMLKHLAGGAPVCVTVTLLDGLVLARSAFHHSMNYRSVVLLGAPRLVEGEERLAALRTIVEHITPGRWAATRAPNDKELAATTVLALAIEEGSAKVRSGPPLDDAEDLTLAHWAGVVPLALRAAAPVPDPALPREVALPEHVATWIAARSG